MKNHKYLQQFQSLSLWEQIQKCKQLNKLQQQSFNDLRISYSNTQNMSYDEQSQAKDQYFYEEQLNTQQIDYFKEEKSYKFQENVQQKKYGIKQSEQEDNDRNQFLDTKILALKQGENTQKYEQTSFGIGLLSHSQSTQLQKYGSDGGVFDRIKLEKGQNFNQNLNFQFNISSKGIKQKKNQISLEFTLQSYLSSLSKKKSFNLSNFSSFNNDGPIQNSSQTEQDRYFETQFQNLIKLIELKTNKSLTAQGIQNIIKQMQKLSNQFQVQEQVEKLVLTERSQLNNRIINENSDTLSQSKGTMNISKISTNISKSNITHQNQLNFKKLQRKSVKSKSPQPKNNSNTSSYKINMKKKINKENINEKQNQKLSMKQLQKSIKPKLESGSIKQEKKILKIIRNNKNMSMEYKSPKDIDQYCIINKIFGKNKQQILWAVDNQRPIITLLNVD